jgi:CubicO group peptidase (beta-lactamase class C family)
MKVKWRSMACICFLPVACIGCSGKNESLVSVQQKNRRVREGFLVRLRQYKVNRSKVNQSLRSLMPRSLRLALAFVFIAAAAHLSAQTAMPISGQAVPSLAQLDTIMQQYMTQYNSPGGNLSVSVDGRLVFARGYGFADTSTGEFVQPDSRMRLASNSKIITAVGILKLIEQGKLSLSTQPFASILKDLKPPSGTTEDPRIQNITISQLLQHTAGYDDGPGYPFDPANDYTTNRNAANAAGLTGAACTPAALISYELGVSLQHDPGATYAYSNLGYLTLGYIIEQVTGIPYATWIEQNIFSIGKMNQTLPAGNLASQKLPYEVAYYGYPGEPLGPSMVPPVGTQVPYEYGAYDLSLELANGGWISTPMDLLRLWDTLNGQYSYNILVGPQTSRVGDVPPLGQGYFYNFYGSLPGTNSLVHLNTSSQMVGNVVYSAIFNTRDKNNAFQPESDADNAIQAYLKTVKSWPTGDLFPTYSTSGTACAFTLPTASTSATVNGQSGFVQLTDAYYCQLRGRTYWNHHSRGTDFYCKPGRDCDADHPCPERHGQTCRFDGDRDAHCNAFALYEQRELIGRRDHHVPKWRKQRRAWHSEADGWCRHAYRDGTRSEAEPVHRLLPRRYVPEREQLPSGCDHSLEHLRHRLAVQSQLSIDGYRCNVRYPEQHLHEHGYDNPYHRFANRQWALHPDQHLRWISCGRCHLHLLGRL